MTSAGRSIGRTFGKMFVLGAGVIAAAGIGRFLKGSIDEAREAQKVGAATAQIIKSTGGAAKVSAKQVGELTTAISQKSGVDDEAIQTGANLLLTFKNVRNEAGQTNDIFNRATQSAVDLSAAGFGSIDSASKQLGKALNDPVKGVSALTRAGVTFTEQQKKQIEKMTESGDILGAQKIILGEVESQVGGVAEATATSGDKAKVAFDNIKESIGTALLPALDSLANTFTTKIAPAIQTFISNLQSGKGSAGAIGDFIRNQLVPAFGTFVDFVRDKVIPLLQEYISWVIDDVVPAMRDALVPWIDKGKEAFNKIRDAIQRNKPELIQLWNAFKKVVVFIDTQLIPKIVKVASFILPILAAQIENTIEVVAFLVDAFNKVKSVFEKVKAGGEKVVGFFKSFPGKVKGFLSGLPAAFARIGKAMIDGLINAVKAAAGRVADAAKAVVKGAIDAAKGALKIGSPSKVMYEIGVFAMDGLANGIVSRGQAAADAAGGAVEKISKKVKEKVATLTDQLRTARSDFASLVEPIASAFTGDLFSSDTATGFLSNLMGTKGTLSGLLDAFKTLVKAGLKPGFLYQLFQSGNAGLIMDLANNPALAAQAGGLFSDVTSLSDQLGQTVAGATDKGAALENQTARLEKKLDKLINHVDRVGPDVGSAVNGAASSGRRRAA